jgi:hypothetical protein
MFTVELTLQNRLKGLEHLALVEKFGLPINSKLVNTCEILVILVCNEFAKRYPQYYRVMFTHKIELCNVFVDSLPFVAFKVTNHPTMITQYELKPDEKFWTEEHLAEYLPSFQIKKGFSLFKWWQQ